MMQNDCTSSIFRLMSVLECALSATHNASLALETTCTELDSLLNAWFLPLPENDVAAHCTCLESQQQQLHQMLDKVDKAVKFSQCVREGREDVRNPWQEENVPPLATKRVVSRTGLKPAVPMKPKHIFKRGGGSIESDLKSPNFPCNVFSKTGNISAPEEENPHPLLLELCPVHCKSKNIYNKKNNGRRSVGVAEAIDVLGIPPELVTILKNFHRYVNRMRSSNAKNKAENAFLRRLNVLNEAQWERIPSIPDCFHSIPLFPIQRQFHFWEKKHLLLEGSKPRNVLSFKTAWNPPALENIPVGTLCVQYQDEGTWLLLQNRMEQLQLSHNECVICDTLLSYSVELLQEFSHAEASVFLKAATALCRISLLNLPFLVKTQHH